MRKSNHRILCQPVLYTVVSQEAGGGGGGQSPIDGSQWMLFYNNYDDYYSYYKHFSCVNILDAA